MYISFIKSGAFFFLDRRWEGVGGGMLGGSTQYEVIIFIINLAVGMG